MRLKGKIIKMGDITEQSGYLRKNAVMEYDAGEHKTAMIECWGKEQVEELQKLKVGDEITIEFRRKWHIITNGYHVFVAGNIRM